MKTKKIIFIILGIILLILIIRYAVCVNKRNKLKKEIDAIDNPSQRVAAQVALLKPCKFFSLK